MFVCDVSMGKAYSTPSARIGDAELGLVREHYDSISAEVSLGGLNYDERVVYSEDAAKPRYLIVYALM